MANTKRATIYVDDVDGDSADYQWVLAWLEKWTGDVVVADYSCNGWDHNWNVSGSTEAISEIPECLSSGSDWSLNVRRSYREHVQGERYRILARRRKRR